MNGHEVTKGKKKSQVLMFNLELQQQTLLIRKYWNGKGYVRINIKTNLLAKIYKLSKS